MENDLIRKTAIEFAKYCISSIDLKVADATLQNDFDKFITKQKLDKPVVSGKHPTTKLVETAAKKHASEILGIPSNEILPDDTIVNGFMAAFNTKIVD